MAHGSNTRMEATFGITNTSSKNNIFPLSLTLGHLEYEKPLNQIETTLIHHTYIHGFNNYFTWEFCLKKVHQENLQHSMQFQILEITGEPSIRVIKRIVQQTTWYENHNITSYY